MTKQITKEEVLNCFNNLEDVYVSLYVARIRNDPGLEFENGDYIVKTVKQFIDQQDEVEAKTLDEIEEEFCIFYESAIDKSLSDSLLKFISYACKQYAASKDKEIEAKTLSRFKCQCDPDKVEYQEYQRTITVVIPESVEIRRNAPDRELRENVCIDVCLVSEIFELWRLGIATTGCCCGHNKGGIAYIGVEEEFIPKMKELGYKVHINPNDTTREDSFYPKSLILLNNE